MRISQPVASRQRRGGAAAGLRQIVLGEITPKSGASECQLAI